MYIITVRVEQDGQFEGKTLVNNTEVVLEFPSKEVASLPSLREKIQRAANAAKARFDDEVSD